jgi:TPR repeat protein
MCFSPRSRFLAASLLVVLALPSHALTTGTALPLQAMGAEIYSQQKDAMGVVLLSVNWNRRLQCSGFENAQLLSLSFDQLPSSRGDDAPGDIVIEGPPTGTVDYAFVAAPGAYALSGFDIRVAKSARDSGGFRAARGRMIRDGASADGGFDVRAGEVVYIGDFSVECRRRPIPWRSYPDGPAEFQEYLGRIKSQFPVLDLGKAQFRPMVTKQFGSIYAAIPPLQAAESLAELAQNAESGGAEAQYRLGEAYDAGRVVPRDLAEAMKWYRRAAEAGYAEAQNSLASALQAERRFPEALAWYEKAAAQEHTRSISSLASLYDAGLGVTQDRNKAFQLWSRAAEQGMAEAMWNLARLYGSGRLGEPDLMAACAWNARARGYAKPFERGLLARTGQTAAFLEKKLHAGELAACRTLAARWVPRVQPK